MLTTSVISCASDRLQKVLEEKSFDASAGAAALSQVRAQRTPASNGIRTPNYASKREALIDCIESVLAGKESAEAALARVTEQINVGL